MQRPRKIIIVGPLLFVLVVLLIACSPKPKSTRLQREWTANAEFAGDVMATEVAPQHGIKLELREGSELLDPVKEVRVGAADFGVASADRVLRENEGGADLIILAASTYKSPVVFLTQPKAHIKDPKEFRRHTVGIQSGTNTEWVYKTLAVSAGLSSKDVRVVESGWGTTNFETGAIDVLAAFDYDEPVQLQLKGFPFETIYPEQYGVRFVGTVYFTRKQLIHSNPKLVQAFMDSLVDGWKLALSNPSEAIQKTAGQFAQMDKAKELKSFQRGREYFSGEDGRLLYSSPKRWDEMAKNLVALKVIKSFDFDRNINYQFLESALNRDRNK